MKVLVIEDDKLLVNLYKLRFNQEKFSSSFANNGLEALEILRKEIPDVILLDFVMPKMDGFSFLTAMKAENFPDIPVIAVTNLNSKEDIAKAEKMNVADYIVKGNTNLDSIIKRVREFDPEKKKAPTA